MNNIYKMIFFSTLTFGTLISISSYSWLGTWMGLEINLLSFIPIINNQKNLYSSELSIKYFLVQALASSSFLFSMIILMILNSFNEMENIHKSILLILNSSLLLKMGAAPLHFWFPEVMKKMNWMQSMILLTWQKIAPMMLISYTLMNNLFFYFIIVSSVTIGSIMGLNQSILQSIMAYSSINHIGWMLSSMMFMENIWTIYFIIYSIISISIMLSFKILNLFSIKQMFSKMNNNMMVKFTLIINMLSLGGLPPFLGFFPKWIVIQNMMMENLIMLNFIMIMMSLVTLFFYLRMSFSILMMSYSENSIILNKIKNKKFLFMINLISMTGLMFSTLIFNMN